MCQLTLHRTLRLSVGFAHDGLLGLPSTLRLCQLALSRTLRLSVGFGFAQDFEVVSVGFAQDLEVVSFGFAQDFAVCQLAEQ